MEVYHASNEITSFPYIRKAKYTKDFSWGFYCTSVYKEAKKSSLKYESGIINTYDYQENNKLNIKKFVVINEEWLDFVAACRNGNIHEFDIVEGPMVDNTIWNYVEDYMEGIINREQFFVLVKNRHPINQVSFHTLKALDCLTFVGSEVIN